MQGTDKLNTITNIVFVLTHARNRQTEYDNQHRICPHGRFRDKPSRNAAAIQEGRL